MTIYLIMWTAILFGIIVYTLVQFAGVNRLKARAEANRYWDTVATNKDLTFLEP
jgi:hypothetical protein